jgi:uncharacterized protein (DUF885 family)
MRLKCWVVIVCVLLATPSYAQTTMAASADAALQALFDREWEWELTQDPLWASYLGDRRWNDQWPDMSLQAIAARQAHRQAVLKDLAAVPLNRLSPANRTNYEIFKQQYDMTVEGYQYRYHLIRTSTLDGVQNTEQAIDSFRFQTVKDYEDWLARLDAFPAYMDQNIALMREGMKTNVVLPKVIVRRVREQVAELASQTPQLSGYTRPFRNMPSTFTAAERDRLAKAGDERIRTRVQPAFARLLAFLDREYLAA